jgi:hypothetical protein
MDIGGVIKAPFQDPEWLKKILLMGLVNGLICITVVGIFVGIPNLYGWGITFARGRMNGDTNLPPFGFSYIGLGYRMIVAALSLIPAYLVVAIVCGVVGFIFGKIHLQIVGMLFDFVVLLAFMPIAFAAMYRFVVHDDIAAGLRIGQNIQFAMGNLGTIIMAVITIIIVAILQTVMGFVPLVGGFFGLGFGVAAINAVYAEMARVTNRA